METEPSGSQPDNAVEEHMVFRVRRTHVFGAAGLVAGFVLGVGAARVALVPPTTRAPVDSGPTARAAAIAAAKPAPPAPDTARKVIDVAGRPTRGPVSAPVTIVEFTDYECPFCRQYFAQTLPAIMEKYGSRVRYVVMNYPLESLHAHANGASQAAECAADQGKFWEYHDALFVAPSLTRRNLRRLAGKVKLDRKAFGTCLDSGAKTKLVQAHVALGTSLGVTGTPSFFINGHMIEGALPLPLLEQAIDSAFAAVAK